MLLFSTRHRRHGESMFELCLFVRPSVSVQLISGTVGPADAKLYTHNPWMPKTTLGTAWFAPISVHVLYLKAASSHYCSNREHALCQHHTHVQL